MQLLDGNRSYRQIESVIDIAVAMSDHTQSPEGCREVPAFLAQAFNIPDVVLAVLESRGVNPPHFILCNSSDPNTGQDDVALRSQLLDIYHRIQSPEQGDGLDLPEVLHVRHPARLGAENDPLSNALLSAVAFSHAIDPGHHMLLMIRRPDSMPEFSFDLVDSMRIIAHELSKQLHCLVTWHRQRTALGEPFSLLSDLEWVVLRGLTSEASEKQLADQLNMRPHTLHSRIKSIYHKTGVQGRLPLIRKFNNAICQLRIEFHRSRARYATCASA